MRRFSKIWTLLLLVACMGAPCALAQTVNLNGTVTDTDGIGWISGSYKISLLYQGTQPATDLNGQNIQTVYQGYMGTGGLLNVTIQDTNFIKPAGAQWQLTFCPAVYGIYCNQPQLTQPITAGNIGVLFNQITISIPPPRISGGQNSFAYADVEVAATPNNSYQNTLTAPGLRFYTAGVGWGTQGGGGGGGALFPNTQGLVYNTSTVASRNATSADVINTLGYTPASSSSVSNTYYVSNSGSDAASGLSPSTPWQTIAKVNSTALNPGDTVLFQSGNIWREQLTISANQTGASGKPLTFGAYGGTSPPIITGSTALTSFVTETGGPSTYYWATAPTPTPNQVIFNGVRLALATSKAALATGTWWLDAPNNRVYVFTNPASQAVEASTRSYNIYMACGNSTYLSFVGITTEYSNGPGIQVCGSNVYNFANGNSIYNFTHGLSLQNTAPSTTVTNYSMSYNEFNGLDLFSTPGIVVDHVNAHHNAQAAAPFYAGIHASDNTNEATNITIENSSTNFNGIVNGAAQGSVDTGAGIWMDTIGTGLVVRGNTSIGNNEKGINIDRDSFSMILANTTANNLDVGLGVFADGGTALSTNLVSGNVSTGDNEGILVEGPSSGEVAGGCINNRIVNNTATASTTGLNLVASEGCENPGTNGSGNVYLGNNFGPASTNFIQWGNSTFYSTYATWEAAAGNCGSVGCSGFPGYPVSGGGGGSIAGVQAQPYVAPSTAGTVTPINSPIYLDALQFSTAPDTAINLCGIGSFCDTRAFQAGTYNTTAQITVGGTSGGAETLILPPGGLRPSNLGSWTGTMTGGTSDTLLQYGGTTIEGSRGAGLSNQFRLRAGTSSSLNHIYETRTGGNGENYYYACCMTVENISGTGAAVAGSAGSYITGSADASIWENMGFFDALDTYDLELVSNCCGPTVRSSQINANYGGTPLFVSTGSGQGGGPYNLNELSIVHPGPGLYAMLQNDTVLHSTILNMNNIYTETNTTNCSFGIFSISGAKSVNLHNWDAQANCSGMSSPAITIANVGTTGAHFDGLTFANGTGDWFFPLTQAIVDNYRGVTVPSDANGHVGMYDNSVTYSYHNFTTGAAGGYEQTIASAATIAPAKPFILLTGTTQVNTITPQVGCTTTTIDCEESFLIDPATGPANFGSTGNIYVASTPAIGTVVTMRYRAATSKWYSSGSSGGSGSGTVSGQASGVIPLGSSASVIGAQSHLSDSGGLITSTEPISSTGPILLGATPPSGSWFTGTAGLFGLTNGTCTGTVPSGALFICDNAGTLSQYSSAGSVPIVVGGSSPTFGAVTATAGLALPGTAAPVILNGSAGTSGNCFVSAGTGATPTWGACTGGPTPIVNDVRTYGAICNGSSNPASAHGYATLSALQAVYSFATATSNQMDWLGAQAALNAIPTSGGVVQFPNGTCIFDQTLVRPTSSSFPGDAPVGGQYIVIRGAGAGVTFIEPTADLGTNHPLISCGAPSATPNLTTGAGTGRYANAGCPGSEQDLSLVMPYTTIATFGVAPTISGTPVAMDGIYIGTYESLYRVNVYGFLHGINLVGNHQTLFETNSNHNYCGLYFAPQNVDYFGDIIMPGSNEYGGNSMAGVCVDKDAYMSVPQGGGEIYVGHEPYGILKLSGTPDAYVGDNVFMSANSFQKVQCESIGNACIWDDNLTQSGGGINGSPASGGSVNGTFIDGFFSSYQATYNVTAGGRNMYAFVGLYDTDSMTIRSEQGSWLNTGANSVPAALLYGLYTQNVGFGNGGLVISAVDLDTALAAYGSVPFAATEDYDYANNYIQLINPGRWEGRELGYYGTATLTTGQIVSGNDGNTIQLSNGTLPVQGVVMQTTTAGSGAENFIAVATSGQAVPVTLAGATTANVGQAIFANASGTSAPLAGGWRVGTLVNYTGTNAGVLNLGGLGGYQPTTNSYKGYGVDTGTANAYAITLPDNTYTGAVAGSFFLVKLTNASTAASTITINGGTARSLKIQNTATTSTISIQANGEYMAFDDGTNIQLNPFSFAGGNTGLSDGNVIFFNSATASKQFKFSGASITAANLRTITIPDANITMAGINFAQTWTAAQSFTTGQIVFSGTAPTMVAGAAAGTTPTCTSVTGGNQAGVISCTTGTSPTTGTLATITFNGTLTAPKGCSLMPRNAATAPTATSVYTTAPSTTTWTIAVATALTASTAYSWSYNCF